MGLGVTMNPRRIFKRSHSRRTDGENMTVRLSDAALQGRMARRKVIAGFPARFKFNTVQEARDYLSGSEIQCLLCGRSLKTLAKHLQSIHGISAEKYREMYGIPRTFGLSCEDARENYARASLKRIAQGNLNMHELSSLRKTFKQSQRPLVPCVARKHGDRGRKSIRAYNFIRRVLNMQCPKCHKEVDYEAFEITTDESEGCVSFSCPHCVRPCKIFS